MTLRRPSRPRRLIHILVSTALVAIATTVPASPTAAQAAVDRLWGQDRYATAAAISRAAFAPGVAVAFVATGANFPDSLAGGPAAAMRGAPILLVTRNSIPASTRTELARLAPQQIAILGGDGVISPTVAGELDGLTPPTPVRHAGSDRYATAAAISAAHFSPGAPVAYIATGRSFPDALAAGAAAATQKGPVLLVDTNSVPGTTSAELARLRPQRIVVAGGPGVVSDAVLHALRTQTGVSVERQAGLNRYGTAAAISSSIHPANSSPTVFVASGSGFADAVAGVPAAAAAGAPLLLSGTNTLPSETASEMRRLNSSRVVLLGGAAALADSVGVAAAANSTLTLVGPWAFALDSYTLQSLPLDADQLIYNGSSILPPYGTRDANGVLKYQASDGNWYDHPVQQAQFVVNMLRNYRLTRSDPTMAQEYLNLAIANANRLMERAVLHGGGIFFPYGFDFGLHGRGTLKAPWYSGMAQGIALSGFVRLYEWTNDPRWLDAANRTYASFLVRPEPTKPWVTGVDGGLLWFEEYPWSPYDHTWNGHNFATFGLFDYWRLTGSEDARKLVIGGITTMNRKSSAVRVPGGVSNYCLAQSCLDRRVRNRNYHLVHISQALYMYRYTRDVSFAALADNFVADYPDFRHGGTTVFAPGEYVGHAFDGTGTAIPQKTVSFPGTSTASYSERTVPHGWSRPGNGIWYFMSSGTFEGLWIRETAQSVSRGFVDRYGYMWPRAHAVPAGTWTGYQVDAFGVETARAEATTAATSWEYTDSARINGQRAVLLSTGPLAGYWLPTVPGTALSAPAVAGLSTDETAGPVEQTDDSPGSEPVAPVPPGPALPEPMPGQIEFPSTDAP